jgi:hypothetical protein
MDLLQIANGIYGDIRFVEAAVRDRSAYPIERD